MRVSTNAPHLLLLLHHLTSNPTNGSAEDKMTLTFRNEMNEMKNMMKALVPTPIPIKAVEERCTTCGSNHNGSSCPLTRGAYDYPVYHDNFQQFQQAAAGWWFCSREFRYPPSSGLFLTQDHRLYSTQFSQAF
ncbi:hypothetical protein Tco_0486613 [Tanacetum coccineum]